MIIIKKNKSASDLKFILCEFVFIAVSTRLPSSSHPPMQNTSQHFFFFCKMLNFRIHNSYFAVRGWVKKNFSWVQWQLKWWAGSACCIIPSANTKGPIFSWNRIVVYVTIVEGMWVECRVLDRNMPINVKQNYRGRKRACSQPVVSSHQSDRSCLGSFLIIRRWRRQNNHN